MSYINSELQVVNNSDVNIEIDVDDVIMSLVKKRQLKHWRNQELAMSVI